MSAPQQNRPIGLFDSGIGGLTVLRAIQKIVPGENIIYLGDTARVPYGTKSRETVGRYTELNVRFLLERGVKMVVVACNTASAYALDVAESVAGDVPVVGVVEGGVRAARKVTGGRKVGVIATEATIRSGVYGSAIGGEGVIEKACPLFVSLVEEGWTENNVAEAAVARYLEAMKGEVGALVLGCTHYPLLKKAISRFLGPEVMLIDSAEETALLVKERLAARDLTNGDGTGAIRLYVTDSPDRSRDIGSRMVGESINLGQPELVDL